jgi:hypothetical protein
VPEPGSLTIMLAGAVMLAGYGWRQRRGQGVTLPGRARG